MAEKSNLRPASFRGVPFKIKRATTRIGRRVVVHEFPFKDEPYTQDLGKGSREYTLEAHVIGDGHEDTRDQFIRSIELNKEPGILVHPIFGAVQVVPGPVEHLFDNEQGNIEYFNLTFHEAGKNQFPAQVINTGAYVESVGLLLSNSLKEDFETHFSIKRLPGFVTTSATYANSTLVTLLQKATGVAPTIAEAKATFDNAVHKLNSNVSNFLADPATYAQTVQEIITSMEGLFEDPGVGFAAYEKLFAYGDDFLPIPQTSPNRKQEKINRDQQVTLVKRQALIGMGLTASKTDFPSYEDAVVIRGRLVELFEAELNVLGASDDDEVFHAVSDLKSAIVLDITERAANLARIKNIFPKESLPALVMSYEIYGNLDHTDELIARNKVQNPNFMPAGQAVQILIE